jgi:hypothetical protein
MHAQVQDIELKIDYASILHTPIYRLLKRQLCPGYHYSSMDSRCPVQQCSDKIKIKKERVWEVTSK